MKNSALQTIIAVALATVTVTSSSLRAAGPVEARWGQICQVSDGRELLVTTNTGHTIEGFCLSIDENGLGVRTKDGKIAHITRVALAHLAMRRSKGHQLNALGKGLHEGLKIGTNELFSPLAPVGAVVLPGTLAWGIMAAPFCVLGDLKSYLDGRQEIKLN